jgi:hypothetical protein
MTERFNASFHVSPPHKNSTVTPIGLTVNRKALRSSYI